MMSKNNKSVKKSFCKVCFDSGKSEKEYTSHFVKSEPGGKGKIVCPTLLNVECSYCHSKGHTKSHCEVLKKNIKQERRSVSRCEYREKKEKKEKREKREKRENVFEYLIDECSGSGSGEDVEDVEVKEDFPALVGCSVKEMGSVEEVKVTSYASIVAKEVKVEKKAIVESETRLKSAMRSWAEWSDSESEEEEDDLKSELSWDAQIYPEDRKEYYEVEEENLGCYKGYEDETDW